MLGTIKHVVVVSSVVRSVSELVKYKERLRSYNRWPCITYILNRINPKVVGSIPTLVRVFLCPCVGPVPSVGLTLTWFIWDRNVALHVTLHSL